MHQPGFLRERLGELLPAHFITAKRRQELERRLLTEHAHTNKDESEVKFHDCFKNNSMTIIVVVLVL